MKTEQSATRLSALLILLLLACSATHAADTLYDQRFHTWTEQAQAGSAAAQYNLGNAYLRGNGVARNVTKALSWLRRSAAQDYAKAEYRLGYLYYAGRGVRQDYGKAFLLLQKSAKHRYSPAQYYLGRLYAEGKGIDQDYHKALYWYRQAAADNYPSANTKAAKMEAAISARANTQTAPIETKPATAGAVPGARPAPAAQPQTRRAAVPATVPPVKKGVPDTEHLLATGKWRNGSGAPAAHLPSALTHCTDENGRIQCRTGKITRSDPAAQVTYFVESTFTRFTPQGRFLGYYRTKILSVQPAKAHEIDPDEEEALTTGWKPKTILKCRFTDDKHIDCVNDNFRREKFTRM